MNNLLRLFLIAGLAACGIVIVALAFVRNDANLLAPVNLVLFLLAAAVYILPAGLAVYRDCKGTFWIVVVNVLLGWTIFGWFIALGWAASGKCVKKDYRIGAPPTHPVPGH